MVVFAWFFLKPIILPEFLIHQKLDVRQSGGVFVEKGMIQCPAKLAGLTSFGTGSRSGGRRSFEKRPFFVWFQFSGHEMRSSWLFVDSPVINRGVIVNKIGHDDGSFLRPFGNLFQGEVRLAIRPIIRLCEGRPLRRATGRILETVDRMEVVSENISLGLVHQGHQRLSRAPCSPPISSIRPLKPWAIRRHRAWKPG